MITAPEQLRRARSAVATDERERACSPTTRRWRAPTSRIVNIGSLEELDAFVASVMERSDGVRAAPLRRWLVARARSAAVALYVVESRPPWYERLRYPLHYTRSSASTPARTTSTRRSLAAVIYQESKFDTRRTLDVGRDRPDAAHARRRRRGSRSAPAARRSASATSTTRRSTSATARGTCTTSSRSTATSGSCSRRTTPARATSTAGCAHGSRSSSPRRARTSRGRAPEARLPRGLGRSSSGRR